MCQAEALADLQTGQTGPRLVGCWWNQRTDENAIGPLRHGRNAEGVSHSLAGRRLVERADLSGGRMHIDRRGRLGRSVLMFDATRHDIVQAVEIGGTVIADLHVDASLRGIRRCGLGGKRDRRG